LVTETVYANDPEAAVVEEKKWVVNCHRCGAALHVQANNSVYMCPVCNNLFRVRKGEKLVKDISRVTVSEAYVNVNKGANE
ncbi:MAG: hypothetical protein IKB20_01105, partial [Clostridia bacterium]|nr:hypothetical protein [Clostridia bacterium]